MANEITETIMIEIKNELGLHARPAAAFVRVASRFSSDILVEKDGEKVDGKSLVGVLMLAAGYGSKVKVTACGVDSLDAISTLKTMTEYDTDFIKG
jgi:phosphocarrier protein